MRCVDLIVIIQFILMIQAMSGVGHTFALPPSFPQQEIIDRPFDLLDMGSCSAFRFSNISKCYTQSSTSPSRISDIKSITYVSDGKFLNATIWMVPDTDYGTFTEREGATDFRYGAYIDTDLNNRTGWNGVDYEIELMRESNSGKDWYILRQWSSAGSARILQNISVPYEDHNLVTDSGKSQRHLLLSINLLSVGFPDNYKIMFYTQYGNKSSPYFDMDFSSWVPIPPPTFSLVTNPNPEVMRPNEKKILYAQLKTSDGTLPEVAKFEVDDTENLENIHAVNVPKGQLSSPLLSSILAVEISVMSGTPEGEYKIPVLANVSESSNHPSLRNVVANTGYAMKRVNLVINVDEPLTIEQHISNFLQTWGSVITFVMGLGLGRFFESVINRIRKWSSAKKEEVSK